MPATPVNAISRKNPAPPSNSQASSPPPHHDAPEQPPNLHFHSITDHSPSILPSSSADPITAVTDLAYPAVSITSQGSSLLSEEDVISDPKRSSKRSLPTKRTAADMAAAERASPSSESSHSMADNDHEAEQFHQSEMSAEHTDQPPKKKRTRTLTTPHQSAVLHSLLAKVRLLRECRVPP